MTSRDDACIAVVNRATGLDDTDAAFMAEAWNLQAREVADVHEVTYTPVIFFGEAEGLPKDCRILTIKNEISAAGAVGVHYGDLGLVFAEVRLTDIGGTQVTGSHEVAEEVFDPFCDRWFPLDDDHEQAGELADRVEGDSYLQETKVLGETRPIRVSNYLLPSAFTQGDRGPFDKLGRLSTWNGMTPGGYTIVRDISTGKVGNVFASRAPRVLPGPEAGGTLALKLAKPGSRLLRRLRG